MPLPKPQNRETAKPPERTTTLLQCFNVMRSKLSGAKFDIPVCGCEQPWLRVRPHEFEISGLDVPRCASMCLDVYSTKLAKIRSIPRFGRGVPTTKLIPAIACDHSQVTERETRVEPYEGRIWQAEGPRYR